MAFRIFNGFERLLAR